MVELSCGEDRTKSGRAIPVVCVQICHCIWREIEGCSSEYAVTEWARQGGEVLQEPLHGVNIVVVELGSKRRERR